jgi:hypothetical protein
VPAEATAETAEPPVADTGAGVVDASSAVDTGTASETPADTATAQLPDITAEDGTSVEESAPAVDTAAVSEDSAPVPDSSLDASHGDVLSVAPEVIDHAEQIQPAEQAVVEEAAASTGTEAIETQVVPEVEQPTEYALVPEEEVVPGLGPKGLEAKDVPTASDGLELDTDFIEDTPAPTAIAPEQQDATPVEPVIAAEAEPPAEDLPPEVEEPQASIDAAPEFEHADPAGHLVFAQAEPNAEIEVEHPQAIDAATELEHADPAEHVLAAEAEPPLEDAEIEVEDPQAIDAEPELEQADSVEPVITAEAEPPVEDVATEVEETATSVEDQEADSVPVADTPTFEEEPSDETETPAEIASSEAEAVESEMTADTAGEPEAASETFDDVEPLTGEVPAFLREDGSDPPVDEWLDEPFTPQTLPQDEIDEGDDLPSPAPRWADSEAEPGELSQEDQPAATVFEETLRPPEEQPADEAIPTGAGFVEGNGLTDGAEDEIPEQIPGEEQLSPEMARFLRSRRRDKKDRPFDGFNSPPGRF